MSLHSKSKTTLCVIFSSHKLYFSTFALMKLESTNATWLLLCLKRPCLRPFLCPPYGDCQRIVIKHANTIVRLSHLAYFFPSILFQASASASAILVPAALAHPFTAFHMFPAVWLASSPSTPPLPPPLAPPLGNPANMLPRLSSASCASRLARCAGLISCANKFCW